MADTLIDKEQAKTWAQEATLKSLLDSANVSSQLLKLLVGKDLSKEQVEALKGLQVAADATADGAKKSPKLFGALGSDFKYGVNRLESSFKSSVSDISKGLRTDADSLVGSLQAASKDLGSGFIDLGKHSGILGAAFFGVAGTILTVNAGILGLWTTVSDLNKSFSTLYNSGGRFESGLIGLAQAADTVGVSSSQLAGTFTQFGTSLALLGTKKATELAARFTSLNRESGDLMMTNQEATEAMFEYIETFKGLGSLQTSDMDKLSKQSRKYWLELTDLSEATGRQRKELNKSIEQQVKDLDLNASIAQYSTEQQDAIRDSIKQFQRFGPEVSGSFTKIMTGFLSGRGIAGLDKSLQLIVTQIPGLYNGFDRIKQQMLRGEDIGPALDQLASQLESPEVAKQLSQFAGAGGEMGAMVSQMQSFTQSARVYQQNKKKMDDLDKERHAEALEKAGGDQKKAKEIYDKEMADRKKATSIFVDTQNQLDLVTTRLGDKFQMFAYRVLTPFFPIFTKFSNYISKLADDWFPDIEASLKTLGDALSIGFDTGDFSKFKEALAKSMDDLFSPANMAKFEKFWRTLLPDGVVDTFKALLSVFSGLGTIVATLSKGFNFLSDHLGAVGATILAFGGYFAAKGVLGKLMDTLTGKIGLGGGAPGGGTTGGMGGTLGEQIGKNIGGLVGGATGAAIQALGTALAALGPMSLQILKGSGAVAGAIGLIGASIAGATWLMGAALPKLSEGLKSLESLDGAKLTEVGKSLGGLSLGLTEFAGSQVATAISGFLSIFSKLAGTDPFSVIKDMASFSTELPKLTAVSEGIKIFSESIKLSMEKFNADFPEVKIGDKFRDVVVFSGNAPALAAVGLALTTLGDAWIKITEAFKTPMPAINLESLNSILSLKDKVNDIKAIGDALTTFKSSTSEPVLNPNSPTTNASSVLEKMHETNRQDARDTAEKEKTPFEPGAEVAQAVLTTKTLQFYEESKQNNKDMKELLQQMNALLDILNGSVNSQTHTLSRSIVKASPIIT